MNKISFLVSFIGSLIFYVFIPKNINMVIGSNLILGVIVLITSLTCGYVGAKIIEIYPNTYEKNSKEFNWALLFFFIAPYLIVVTYWTATS